MGWKGNKNIFFLLFWEQKFADKRHDFYCGIMKINSFRYRDFEEYRARFIRAFSHFFSLRNAIKKVSLRWPPVQLLGRFE